MRITTKAVYEIETLNVISWEGYTYEGPVEECKKGRETVEQNAAADQATAKQNRANSQAAYDKTQGLVNENIGSSTPGSLTPASTAQLASDRDQIANTYNGIRQTAFRTLGQRGLGSAPSGFAATANNAADLGQATADTGAFRNAQINTQNQRNFATTTEAGLTGQQGNLGNTASSESTTAAVDRSKMGSTAGDVLGAVAEIAPIAAAPFTGGASLLPMLGGQMANMAFSNAFSKLGSKTGSGVGSYGSSGGGIGNAPWTPQGV